MMPQPVLYPITKLKKYYHDYGGMSIKSVDIFGQNYSGLSYLHQLRDF